MSDNSEKGSHHDFAKADDIQLEALPTEDIDPVLERKAIRRVDIFLVPLSSLLYSFALIDRTNLGIARVAGMAADLELLVPGTGIDRYSLISCIYFVPYILLQLPSNLMLRKLGVRLWLTICVVGWGISQLGMGFVKNYGQLAICRVLLGIFEAGFFPALVYVLTTWYKRHEVQKRLAAFYLTSIVLSGFSSIFAYVLTLLKGRGGLNGWNWIFIIEGIITIVLGVLAWFFVADFPDKNRFLTKEQTKIVLARVEVDRGDALPDELTTEKVLHHLADWTTWAYGLMFMCSTMPAYTIGFFTTIILQGMGYSVVESFLLTAPPYLAAAIFCFTIAWLSDKFMKRALFIALQVLVTIVGITLIGFAKQNGARYLGIFFTNMGASGCVPGVLAYSANNVVSHSKRAVSTAMTISFGGIGGIFATTVFRQQDFPRYVNGVWATIACQLFFLLLLATTTFYYSRKNREAREKGTVLEGHPGFLYTL